MKKIVAIIAILAGLASCVYPYDPELEGTSEDIVVFEGSIVAGGTSTVKFSNVSSLSTPYYTFKKISGTACVEDDKGTVYNPSSPDPSSNVSIPMDNAPTDRKYRMKAVIDDLVYYSDWLEPLAPPEIEDVSFSLFRDSTTVLVSVLLNTGEQGTGYVGITYDETWEFHADFQGQYFLDTLSWEVFPEIYPNYWCWKTVSSTDMMLLNYSAMSSIRGVPYTFHSFPCSNNRIQKLYSINVKAITMSEKAYRFMNNLAYISNGNGSLFSPNPGEMASNIRCDSDPERHVEGYIFASKAASVRAFLDNRYYKYSSPSTSNLFIPDKEIGYRFYYESDAYPIADMSLPVWKEDHYEDVSGLYWGPIRCIDCVVAGGTKQKPDFWP